MVSPERVVPENVGIPFSLFSPAALWHRKYDCLGKDNNPQRECLRTGGFCSGGTTGMMRLSIFQKQCYRSAKGHSAHSCKTILCVLGFCALLLASSGRGWAEEGGQGRNPEEFEVKEGMSLEEVRRHLGMPRNITRAEWRYPDRILLIENQQVACIIRPSCTGKWANCHGYRTRSPECLLP